MEVPEVKRRQYVLMGLGAGSVGARLITAGILPKYTMRATIELEMGDPVRIEAVYFAEGDTEEFVAAFEDEKRDGDG